MSNLREEEILKINDIKKKLEIVKHVVAACHADKENKFSYLANFKNTMFIGNTIRHYTGLDLNIILTYINQHVKKTALARNATIWNHQNFHFNEKHKIWDAKLRERIMFMYLRESKVPTISALKCSDVLAHKNYSDEEVLMYLHTRNYIQQKIEGTSKAIIIENPQKIHERFRYLEAMKTMRLSGLNIVYINENKIELMCRHQWDYVAVTTTNTDVGVLAKFKFGPNNQQTRNIPVSVIENWIISSVLPQLLSPSVIVLEDSIEIQNFTTAPTIHSTKKEMIEWLTVNGIPHRTSQHRAELYEIIKRSKRHCPHKIYSFDNLVNAKGHKVLRQPKGVDCLNYFNILWPDITCRIPEKKSFTKLIANEMLNKPLNHWVELEKSLIYVENKMYNEDLQMENVIDKLLTFGKYYPLGADLFQQCDEVANGTKLLDMIVM